MPQPSLSLPHDYILRKAKPIDLWLIAFLILKAKLDPTQLNWQKFWIIEYYGRLVAFGQLRNFHLAQEIGSLYVVPDFRNQGLGTILIKHLVAQANQPLYLKCSKEELKVFYSKRGFKTVGFEDLPRPLKFKFYIFNVRKKLLHTSLTFMKYEPLIKDKRQK